MGVVVGTWLNLVGVTKVNRMGVIYRGCVCIWLLCVQLAMAVFLLSLAN